MYSQVLHPHLSNYNLNCLTSQNSWLRDQVSKALIMKFVLTALIGHRPVCGPICIALPTFYHFTS